MSSWVLILVLLGPQGAGISSQYFTSEQHCKAAGDAASKLVTMYLIKYTCAPTGR